MFKIKTAEFADEIAKSMEDTLVSQVIENKNEQVNQMTQAVELINQAAEIFDGLGLRKEAEAATILLEIVAGKKKPKKKVKKSPDAPVKNLSSKKMVENLKEKGWVFNADDDHNHNHDSECMSCDSNYVEDKSGKCEYCGDNTKVEQIRCTCGKPFGKVCGSCAHIHNSLKKKGRIKCDECDVNDASDVNDNREASKDRKFVEEVKRMLAQTTGDDDWAKVPWSKILHEVDPVHQAHHPKSAVKSILRKKLKPGFFMLDLDFADDPDYFPYDRDEQEMDMARNFHDLEEDGDFEDEFEIDNPFESHRKKW